MRHACPTEVQRRLASAISTIRGFDQCAQGAARQRIRPVQMPQRDNSQSASLAPMAT